MVKGQFSGRPDRAGFGRWWGHPRYWACQAVFWFGYGVLLCTAASATFSDQVLAHWRYFLLDTLTSCVLGLLVSHLVRLCNHVGRWTQRGWGATIVPVALLCLAYGLTCAWLAEGFGPPPPHGVPALRTPHEGVDLLRPPLPYGIPPLRTFHEGVGLPPEVRFPSAMGPSHGPRYFEFLRGTLVMLAWAGIYLGYGYERQLRASQLDRVRLDASAKEAQLRALQNQLNPHFLFNSLNTIRALIEEDGKKARQVVTNLSDLLRAHLRAGDRELVPVRLELATLQAYLDIETCRYEERLRLDVKVDPGALDLLVPPFVLQTLVENAIKHGIAVQPEGGCLSFQVRKRAHELYVRVSNPGALGTTGTADGTGLANARERLRLLFGEAAALELSSQPNGLVVAELRMPKVSAIP